MQKVPAVLVAILLIGLFVWSVIGLLPGTGEAPTLVPQETATTTQPVSQWQWGFEDAGEDAESGAPKTRVTLRNGETSYVIGSFLGSCVDMRASSWKIAEDEGELAGAVCWWAGGGNEIGVFSEEGKAVVKIGELDEGDAENSSFRGNFVTRFEIDFGFIRALTDEAILFDDARWLSGTAGEDAAIAAGICTEETRSECLPNDFYILDQHKATTTIPLSKDLVIYMLTWHSEEESVKRQTIRLGEFTGLINDRNQHWNQLPYNITVKDGEVIVIEEVYVP